MASLLNLRQAARLIGVSPGRLYRAIADGRLAAAPGGGSGRPTLINLEALQAFCRSEGLRVPDEADLVGRPERLERSGRAERAEHTERSSPSPDEARVQQTIEALASQYLAQMLARQSDYIETFVREELSHLVSRVVEHVAERFTAPQTARTVERSLATPEASADEDLLALLKALLPQKRYLRDLGIETLPLARLNARLAPFGYVIDAKKVRDARRFVACTDAYGHVFELRPVAARPERPERSERSIAAAPEPKAAMLTRLRTMQAEGLSLQAIANRLNAEGVPTLSGKGRWQKGTVGNLLAQRERG
jgi:hypothetical protein